MRNIHTLSIVTLLTLSTTIMHGMELQRYEPNTIKNLTKKRNSVCAILHILKDASLNPTLTIREASKLFVQVYFPSDESISIDSNLFNAQLKQHSMIGITIISQRPFEFKKNFISLLLDNCTRPTPKDRQFADLELYERKVTFINTLCLFATAAHKDQNSIFALLPAELIQYISQLIIETEKSLI